MNSSIVAQGDEVLTHIPLVEAVIKCANYYDLIRESLHLISMNARFKYTVPSKIKN